MEFADKLTEILLLLLEQQENQMTITEAVAALTTAVTGLTTATTNAVAAITTATAPVDVGPQFQPIIDGINAQATALNNAIAAPAVPPTT